uniref:Acyltransferase 3 domain-containing protein n=1 Tax=Strigamia maritima TaxID=126957 RepID=T1JK46_STRMM
MTVRASFSVDTFFTLSGLLLTRSFLKRQEKVEGSYLWILKLYFLRYLRLTPVYAVVLIIFQTILFPYYSNSSLWPQHVNEHCYKYWWKHLLYINNIKPNFTEDCFGESWYLAIDMQFHIISPIILIFLFVTL